MLQFNHFSFAVLLGCLYLQAASAQSKYHCATEEVRNGDSCRDLSARCGITLPQFVQHNSQPNLCLSLAPGQRVCCSAGTLPIDGYIRNRSPSNPTSLSSNGNGTSSEDLPPISEPEHTCNETFQSLEDLDGARASIPEECMDIVTLGTLSNVLNDSLTSYHDMLKHKYDAHFKVYAEYTADSAAKNVDDWVNKNGNKYFSCIVSETAHCCKRCNQAGGKGVCKNCYKKGSCYKTVLERGDSTTARSDQYESELSDLAYDDDARYGILERDHPMTHQILTSKVVNQSEPCPPDYSQRGSGPTDPYMQSVYWTLLPERSDAFYADLLNGTGIDKKFIDFKRNNRGNGCAPSAKANDDCWGYGIDYNFPQPVGYKEGNVTNPKDMVQKAINNTGNLQQQLSDTLTDLRLGGALDLDVADLVDAVSLPILMIADSVDNMVQDEQIGQKITEEKKKSIVLMILSAIFLVVPFIGEGLGGIAGSALGAAIRGTLTTIGVGGDVAMGIYGVVTGPHNDLLAIFNLILAPMGLINFAKIARAARLTRKMPDGTIKQLGPTLSSRMAILRKDPRVCRRKF